MNQVLPYCAENDIRGIQGARARPPVPSYPGMVHIATAARHLGISERTLRDRLKGLGHHPQDRPAKSVDGRALPRSYVSLDALAKLKPDDLEADKITVTEAAKLLSMTRAGVHSAIHRGALRALPGEAPCVRGDPRGKLRYTRGCLLLSRSEVLAYRDRAAGGLNGQQSAITKTADTAPSQSPVILPNAPFIPSAFQQRILEALKGRNLTADNLQTRLGGDRRRLFRDGLMPLQKAGLIRNSRRIGGYYRPDAPPPKYAEFLGKNH